MWKKLFFVIFLLMIVSSCSKESYTPIKTKSPLIATVNIKDQTVTFIDAETRKTLANWALHKPYLGGVFLPDGDTIILYGKEMNTIDLYSLEKGKQTDQWKVGTGIVNSMMLSSREEVVFADQLKQRVRIFSLRGKELASIQAGNKPYTLIGNDKESLLYVISLEANLATILDLEDKEVLEHFPIHEAATGGVLLEKNNQLWIGGHGKGNVIEEKIHVYHSTDGELINTIAAPVMPVNFTKWKDNVFVLSHGNSTVYKSNNNGELLSQNIVGSNPFELAILNDELIISGYDSNEVYFINPTTLKIKETIPVGRGPFKMMIRERLQ